LQYKLKFNYTISVIQQVLQPDFPEGAEIPLPALPDFSFRATVFNLQTELIGTAELVQELVFPEE
jgi:hypothetical protein